VDNTLWHEDVNNNAVTSIFISVWSEYYGDLKIKKCSAFSSSSFSQPKS
jgi:hypothetical protein